MSRMCEDTAKNTYVQTCAKKSACDTVKKTYDDNPKYGSVRCCSTNLCNTTPKSSADSTLVVLLVVFVLLCVLYCIYKMYKNQKREEPQAFKRKEPKDLKSEVETIVKPNVQMDMMQQQQQAMMQQQSLGMP